MGMWIGTVTELIAHVIEKRTDNSTATKNKVNNISLTTLFDIFYEIHFLLF